MFFLMAKVYFGYGIGFNYLHRSVQADETDAVVLSSLNIKKKDTKLGLMAVGDIFYPFKENIWNVPAFLSLGVNYSVNTKLKMWFELFLGGDMIPPADKLGPYGVKCLFEFDKPNMFLGFGVEGALHLMQNFTGKPVHKYKSDKPEKARFYVVRNNQDIRESTFDKLKDNLGYHKIYPFVTIGKHFKLSDDSMLVRAEMQFLVSSKTSIKDIWINSYRNEAGSFFHIPKKFAAPVSSPIDKIDFGYHIQARFILSLVKMY
ncbi:MAG: hypothetical protein H6850_03490 [Alphaproteobacteria bacterium]|nr:MAG: hypothetical protein H6850_03490 [Alphaproteobacteria bacterium]